MTMKRLTEIAEALKEKKDEKEEKPKERNSSEKQKSMKPAGAGKARPGMNKWTPSVHFSAVQSLPRIIFSEEERP